MKKKIILLVIGCLFLMGCNAADNTQNLTQSAGKKIVCYGEALSLEPLYQFSYDFFGGNMETENPIMSPLSAYCAMSLAASGADGETRQELEELLGKNFYRICDKMADVLPRTGSDTVTVSLANSAWLDDNFKANIDWLSDVNTYFEADVFRTDLSTQEAKTDINQWCSEQTKGLIPEFLQKPLPEDTRLALLNTLYFCGRWRDRFGEGATREEAFYLEDGTLATVDMMRNYEDYQFYFEKEGLEGVCLPYYEGITFVALKPTDETTIRDLYNSLTMEELIVFAKTDTTTFINLKLPKFEAECSMELVEYFKELGIEAAFDATLADFQPMGKTTSGEAIYISDIIQQAVIKVDEDGTEVAAVTMVAAAEGAMEPEEAAIEVFFDKPFFYMIYDKNADAPLFMGIFEKP